MIHRAFKILHIEDHLLYANGFKDSVMPFLPLAEYVNIQDGYKAIEYIEEQITNGISIDLIITDINHPGLMGDELVQRLRLFEKEKGTKPIPLIVLSNVVSNQLLHISNPALMVDKFILKISDTDKIVEAIEGILCLQ